jgi:hypothetical protein
VSIALYRQVQELEARVKALEEADARRLSDAQVQLAVAKGPTETPFLRQKKARA